MDNEGIKIQLSKELHSHPREERNKGIDTEHVIIDAGAFRLIMQLIHGSSVWERKL